MTFKDILLYIHTYISVFDQPSAQMLPASVDGKKTHRSTVGQFAEWEKPWEIQS